MILVHTLWMYSSTELQSESLFGAVIHILGKGTASFLVAMGLSMALSRRQTPMLLIKRGIQLLLLAYLMNAAKFWLPIDVFNTMPEAFINAYGWQSPLSAGQLQFMVLTGDILQLAGVSLLLFGALNIARWKTAWIACLAIAIAPRSCKGPAIYAFAVY
ncbi:heparan-alpha-glucosaminide N-acetyltransferase domain-containing protein (plasmid) [Pseudoalteromonas espejiana]